MKPFQFAITAQPALLIECGFLSNADEAARLADSDEQKKVAFTIYRGLIEFLNQNSNESQMDVQTTEEQNAEHQEQTTQNHLLMQ
jgi:N-acetylmuramoyl-L-alanine amidase